MSIQKDEQDPAGILPAIQVDQEARKITLHLEDGSIHTMSLERLAGFLVWLIERESELRRLVFANFPVPLRQPMRPNGFGYVCGRTEERQLVRVEQARYEAVLAREAEMARKRYFAGLEAKRDMHPLYNQLEANLGMAPLDPYAGPTDHDIMAAEYAAQHLVRVRQPEWWVLSDDNLDAGKTAMLP